MLPRYFLPNVRGPQIWHIECQFPYYKKAWVGARVATDSWDFPRKEAVWGCVAEPLLRAYKVQLLSTSPGKAGPTRLAPDECNTVL